MKEHLTILLLLISSFVFSQEDQWTQVEFDPEMLAHLQILDDNEKLEQCRDWLKYAVINKLKFDEKVNFELLYDYNAFRYPFLDKLSAFEYGDYRYWIVGSELYTILPYSSPLNKSYIAQLADSYRKLKGRKVENIHLFYYVISSDENYRTKFQIASPVPKSELFSKEYGYVEKKVSTKNQLLKFLTAVDDVSYVRIVNERVLFGGRKYQEILSEKITLEDLAVLYQADNNIKEQYLAELETKSGFYDKYFLSRRKLMHDLTSRNTTLYQALNTEKEQYADLLKLSPTERRQLRPYTGKSYKKIKEIFESNIEYYEAHTSLSKFIPYYKKNVEIDEGIINIGFSLDPAIQYNLLAREIRKMISDSDYFEKWYNDYVHESHRESAILYLKEKEKEKRKDSTQSSDFNIDELLQYEVSLTTMISAPGFQRNQDYDYQEVLQRAFEISEEQIEQEVSSYKEMMRQSVDKNNGLLEKVAKQITNNKGKQDWEKMALFYSLRAYGEGLLDFSFSGNYRGTTKENYLIILYDKVVQDVGEMLTNYFYMQDTITDFDDEMESLLIAFRSETGLPQTNLIDNQLFEELLQAYGRKIDLLSIFGNAQVFDKRNELNFLSNFLFDIRAVNSYQRGQYYGKLQGTQVGMTLYYTDLMMKLWGFDYLKTAPHSIPGFYSKTNYKLSLVHLKSENLNSSTRSWLSFKPSSVEYYSNGEAMYFDHIVTKIFNASSNDMEPGKEVPANHSSKRFADWWNKNYRKVANYEPEYHRLNQIQKWSHIIYWLKYFKKLTWLNQERLVKTRNLDFENWYKESKHTKVKVDIPFLDKEKLREKTECLAIIRSSPYFKYLNYDGSSSLSGGVSLSKKADLINGIKVPKPLKLISTNIDRPNINFRESPISSGKYTTTDGVGISLSPKTRTSTLKQAPNTEFASEMVKTYSLEIVRKIENGKVIQHSNGVGLGELSAKGEGLSKVMMKMKRVEQAEMHQFLVDVTHGGRGWEVELNRSSQVETLYKIVKENGRKQWNEYIVKLKGRNNTLKIREMEIPPGRQDADISTSLDIRIGKGRKTYLDSEILTLDEASSLKSEFKYYRIENEDYGRSNIVLSNIKPQVEGKLVYFKRGDQSFEAIQTDEAWIFKNDQSLAKVEVVNVTRDIYDFLRRQGENLSGIIFDENGHTLFGLNPIKYVNIKKINETVAVLRSDVDIIVFNSNGTIKFLNNRSITIPKPESITPTNIEALGKMKVKINQDARYKDLWSNYDIEMEDLIHLEKLDATNYNLAKSFYSFKETNNLRFGDALLDYSTNSTKVQFVIKDQNRTVPRVVELETKLDNSIVENSEAIRKILSENINNAEALFRDKGQMIFEVLEDISHQSDASRFITRGDVINTQKLYSYFGGSKVRFCKDNEEDVINSIENINTILDLDFKNTVLLSTTSLISPDFPKISLLFSEVTTTGVAIDSTVSTTRFFEYLEDSTVNQLFLVARGNQDGLIFSNAMISYENIAYRLWRDRYHMGKKDFIYIISNQCDTLEQIFAESKLFNFVYSACYNESDKTSFQYALEGFKAITQPYVQNNCRLKTKQLNKMLNNNPYKSTILEYAINSEGKYSTINLSKLNQEEKGSFSEKQIKKITRRNKGYKSKPLNKLFDEFQDKQIEKLKQNKNNFRSKFRAIPRLKCDNNKSSRFKEIV